MIESSTRTLKLATLALGLSLATSVNAQLMHYYFDPADGTDITVDRVGSANGTPYGAGTFINANGLYTDGAGGGLVGGVPANGMLLDSAAVAGITGSFALNQWFTPTGNGYQAWLIGFSDGTSANMLAMLEVDNWWPQYPSHAYVGIGGAYTDVWGLDFDNGQTIAEDPFYGSWLDQVGDSHMVTLTYDQATLSLYVDTVLAGSAPLAGLNLSLLTTPVVAGGSPWGEGDRAANGDTHSFAIFADSLDADQISAVYALGQDASVAQINAVVPEPGTTSLLFGLSVLVFVAIRRRQKESLQGS